MFSSYVLAFNKQHKRTGSLLQKRFKRVTIKDDFKLLSMLAYIHHNPIHHKFCNNLSDWKYSSYKTYLSGAPTHIMRSEMLRYFDKFNIKKSKELFIEYHENYEYEDF